MNAWSKMIHPRTAVASAERKVSTWMRVAAGAAIVLAGERLLRWGNLFVADRGEPPNSSVVRERSETKLMNENTARYAGRAPAIRQVREPSPEAQAMMDALYRVAPLDLLDRPGDEQSTLTLDDQPIASFSLTDRSKKGLKLEL